MKGNEMLFEIIYIYILVCGCGFSVIQVKASKFTEGVKIHRKRFVQENRKSRGDSNNING